MALLDATGISLNITPDGLRAYVQICCPLISDDMLHEGSVRSAFETYLEDQGIQRQFLLEDGIEQAVEYLMGIHTRLLSMDEEFQVEDEAASEQAISSPAEAGPGFQWYGQVAEGIDVRHGQDSRLKKYFLDQLQPGRVDDQGRMDYRERGYVQVVEPQTLLAELVKPTPGDAGTTVLGEPIPAEPGQMRDTLNFDAQTVACEEKTDRYEFRARITGCVEYRENRLALSLETRIERDVDIETGNIAAVGDLRIEGSVMEGFRVETTGSLEIRGDVHKGAFLKAHYINVTGVCHGQVLATMNVIMVSAESTYVRAGNMIAVERATSSRLEAASILCDSLHSSICWASRLMQIERVRESPSNPSVLRLAPHPLSHKTWQVFKTELALMQFELDWRRRIWEQQVRQDKRDSAPVPEEIEHLERLCRRGKAAQRRWLAQKTGRMSIRLAAAHTRIRFYGRTFELEHELRQVHVRWDSSRGAPSLRSEDGP